MNRKFRAPEPNRLWVSDFRYVSTWQGFVYVAFVIDTFANRIVGWRMSRSAKTDFVLDALEQALHDRQPPPESGLFHHSDGWQYLSIRYTERLAEAGIEPPVGSVDCSYEFKQICTSGWGDPGDPSKVQNALVETTNGLYKTELVHRQGPWCSMQDLELAKLDAWIGSTIAAYSGPSETFHQPKPKRITMRNVARLIWSRKMKLKVSGKTGAIHHPQNHLTTVMAPFEISAH